MSMMKDEWEDLVVEEDGGRGSRAAITHTLAKASVAKKVREIIAPTMKVEPREYPEKTVLSHFF